MHKNWHQEHKAKISWSDRLGLRITAFVGTMLCAGIFAVIAFISLPSILKEHSVIADVAWLAQTFLQLVLLSIIMVGQNQQSARDKTQAEHQYKHQELELLENTKLTREVHKLTTAINKKLK
jgi:uncharacterized membrane protein